MFPKYILPLLAVAGVGFAIYTAIHGARTIPPALPVSDAPQPPYAAFVAGSGIVEANTENIAIGTAIAGVVTAIDVKLGVDVKAGDPLFTLDDRAQRAEVAARQAAVEVADAQLADAEHQRARAEGIADKRAMSVEELIRRQDAARTARAQATQTRALLAAAQTDLERLTVRAPVDGQILQLKVHLGEFAPAGVLAQPLILLGAVTPLSLRVNVDENDAWRVRAGAIAIGYLRGNKEISAPLKFVRFEPYVVPKTSLTGDTTERVDTRVLQMIFNFDRGDLPIFVGQQMDVYIEAPEPKPETPTPAKPKGTS